MRKDKNAEIVGIIQIPALKEKKDLRIKIKSRLFNNLKKKYSTLIIVNTCV